MENITKNASLLPFGKIAGILLLVFAVFAGPSLMAQGNRDGQRERIRRDDRRGAGNQARVQVRPQEERRTLSRPQNGSFNRSRNELSRVQSQRNSVNNNDNRNRPPSSINNSYRRNNNTASINRNRPGNYNRPGNNYNRPGNNFRANRPGYYYNRRPVYNAYNPSWRYAHMPRRYSVFNTVPSFYLNLNFGGSPYRYYDGIYYRPYNNVFRVVAPPIGIFINALPRGHRRIYVNDYPYYYYNGTYYDQRDNQYIVVSPPVGAVVESIPDGYKTITIDGETFYEIDGAQYKPAVQENGEIWYEVIKSNK